MSIYKDMDIEDSFKRELFYTWGRDNYSYPAVYSVADAYDESGEYPEDFEDHYSELLAKEVKASAYIEWVKDYWPNAGELLDEDGNYPKKFEIFYKGVKNEQV